MIEEVDLQEVFFDILENTRLHLYDLKPSDWYEANMVMPRGSAFPGPFSYKLTPYWREPLDCAGKNHPAKEVSIKKGAQLGGTAAVLNPIVGYIISQNPGNAMFLTGHTDLSEKAFVKIDHMIDNCGLRPLIRPSVQRAKNSRTGDTNKLKEFPGGDLKGGSVTNHNLLRQDDVMIMIVDDFDAAPMSSKHAGSTRELVQARTKAFAHKKKIFYVSSPQLEGSSNIDAVFKLGDQRYWNVPCPNCNKNIVLKWRIDLENKEVAGIWWDYDALGNLDRKSVCYICQECSKTFKDSHKYEMNLAGLWVPTVVAKEENHWSYQISSLYSPPGMDDWAFYVQQYINANPVGGSPDHKKNQTFMNTTLGETYKQEGKSLDDIPIQGNTRNDYKIGSIPESVSIKDGNGRIPLITCACDLNGKDNDARLDYEIVAWSKSGSSYSIMHGSIGTFIPNESKKEIKEDREHWTYQFDRFKETVDPETGEVTVKENKQRSVWPVLEEIINQTFYTDDEKRPMKILAVGIDYGHFTSDVYTFLDKTNHPYAFGVRGDKEGQYRKHGIDMPVFKPARERAKAFLIDVNLVKDRVANLMELKWERGNVQPPGFMNYPSPAEGMYDFKRFFSHYQAEHYVEAFKDGASTGYLWKKKDSSVQNHFWDIFVYGYTLHLIWASLVCKEATGKHGEWDDFIKIIGI